MTEKRWKVRTVDKQAGQKLYDELKIRPIYCNLLVARGILTRADAHSFFRPEAAMLHNPWEMKGMTQAVQRISDALRNNEKILLYGDYDVDGTTAVALLYSFLRDQFPEAKIDFYVPDRHKEGYGLSCVGIDYAHTHQCPLIVALDCGVRAIPQIAYARSLGLDVIVCDHHLPDKQLPAATALLNPKQEGCNYPYKDLSGCGIAYKLISALAINHQRPDTATLPYLDLVTTSIAADLVPLTGENRVLAALGLQKMQTDALPGLSALMAVSKLRAEVSIRDVAFMIAPRINAAGRLGDARQAIRLLIAKKTDEATVLAAELHALNDQRKQVEKEITDAIVAKISQDPGEIARKSTVVFDPSWHKGVIGITASRIMETYYRPTIVLTGDGQWVSGSARSVRGFNIFGALKQCAPLLERFGGHDFAAGMTLHTDNVAAFSKKFEEVVAASIAPDQLIAEIEIDAEVAFCDLSQSFYNLLTQFEPFGPGNRQPIFLLKNVVDNGYSTLIRSQHIRFEIMPAGCPGQSLAGIGFNLAEKFDIVSSGAPFDLCFSLEKNTFRGRSLLQLRVLDLRPTQPD